MKTPSETQKAIVLGYFDLPEDIMDTSLPEGTRGIVEVQPPISLDDDLIDAVLGQNPGSIRVSELASTGAETILSVETDIAGSTHRTRREIIETVGCRIVKLANNPDAATAMKQQSPFAGY